MTFLPAGAMFQYFYKSPEQLIHIKARILF